MAKYIENKLIEQKLIDENNTIIFTNEGSIAETVEGKSTDNGGTWYFDPINGELVVYQETPSEHMVIPNVIDGKKVESLVSFQVGDDYVKIIEISYGIIRIECAFENYEKLTSVSIPNSVTSIGHSAFAYCTSLTSITIPSSVTSIEQYAFLGCPLSIINIKGPQRSFQTNWNLKTYEPATYHEYRFNY